MRRAGTTGFGGPPTVETVKEDLKNQGGFDWRKSMLDPAAPTFTGPVGDCLVKSRGFSEHTRLNNTGTGVLWKRLFIG